MLLPFLLMGQGNVPPSEYPIFFSFFLQTLNILYCLTYLPGIKTDFSPKTFHAALRNKAIPYCSCKHPDFRMTGFHICRNMFSISTVFYIFFHSHKQMMISKMQISLVDVSKSKIEIGVTKKSLTSDIADSNNKFDTKVETIVSDYVKNEDVFFYLEMATFA